MGSNEDQKKLRLHAAVSRELKLNGVNPAVRAFLLHVMRDYERRTPFEQIEADARNYGILLKPTETSKKE